MSLVTSERRLRDTPSEITTRVQALMVVKDECDIVELCLRHASRFCTNIFVLDNGSTDGTWEIVQDLGRAVDAVVPMGTMEGIFYTARPRIFREVRDRFDEGDWILVLDADEFLESDPRPLLARSGREGREIVRSLFAQFVVTTPDLETRWFDSAEPVRGFDELPRHYRIDWEENRFFRYSSRLSWPESDTDGSVRRSVQPVGARGVFGERLVTRHYQYRSRKQMIKRLQIRSGLHEARGYFRHNAEVDWRAYVQAPDSLKRVDPDDSVDVTWFEAVRSRWRREKPLHRLIRGVRRRLP